MKRSNERILTTHAGSLPRPADLLEMMAAKQTGPAFDARVRSAVAEAVHKQADAGIDVVSDGEMGKPSFVHYVRDRLKGFEGVSTAHSGLNFDEEFPGYGVWRARGRTTVMASPFGARPECIGPLSWKDHAALQADIDNFKAALGEVNVEEAFIPCASVGIIAQRMANAYYPSYEAFVQGIAEVMRDEYSIIAKAGLIVQIDAPEMCIDRALPDFRDKPIEEFNKRQMLWVEALNYALEGVPEEQVRFHVCWGNGEAPHTRDVPLKDIVDVVLKVNAAAYSVEASNPRHAHEWKLWRDVKLPEGKVLIPRRHRLGDQLYRASGAGGGPDPQLRQHSRARERHRWHGLRLRHRRWLRQRLPTNRLGEAEGAVRRRRARVEAALEIRRGRQVSRLAAGSCRS
jgi:5-methyltetrahydropteroyltriglutamate--homocysteine methyltransferase